MENFGYLVRNINNFNCDYKGNIGLEWKHYVDRLNHLFLLVKPEQDEQKLALLFLLGGLSLKKIDESLQYSKEEDNKQLGSKYDKTLLRLGRYFHSKTNKRVEVLKFQQAKQRKDEPLESFVRRLFMLSLNCQFLERDLKIIEQLILTCGNNDFREELMASKKLNLNDLLKLAVVYDGADFSVQKQLSSVVEKESSSVQQPRWCMRCDFEHEKNECPARGKLCYACGYMNHFARMCKSKSFRGDDSVSSSKFLIK